MRNTLSSLDYGERLVLRYRASGLTRKDFAEQADISVSTLDYYVRRERKAPLPAAVAPNRILPVELFAPEEATPQASAFIAFGCIRICLADGRAIEVRRGFDAELLREVVAALETRGGGERG